jgi:uncharacterized membrane protein
MKKMERIIKTNFILGFVDTPRTDTMKEKLDKMSTKELKEEYTWVLNSFMAKVNEYTSNHVLKKDESSQYKLAVINLMKAHLELHLGFLGYVLREKKEGHGTRKKAESNL